MPRTLYLILHSRYPAEKAASLFAAKSAEAFARAGQRVVLLVPRRFGKVADDPYAYYKIERNFETVYLPVVDLFPVPVLKVVAFYVSFVTFSLAVWWYLRRHAGTDDIMYSNESLALWAASFVSPRCLYEMHDFPEHKATFYHRIFRRCQWLLVTNSWKMGRIRELLSDVADRAFLEQNAVDLAEFPVIAQQDARAHLSLPREGRIAVYTGHLYGWKGVDVLAAAARTLTDVEVYFVGGTNADVARFRAAHADAASIHVVGHKPHAEMAWWQAAADVLVLPNTATETISAYYTSPMKLFEYMASARPIVASDLASIRELLHEENAILVPPDDPNALAEGIRQVFEDPAAARARAREARAEVETHTWDARARRILRRIAP